ncbi:MAG: twin arginine-targeting protein translocase TatC [Betaproteobacteria bacterium RIFCSPHIGHO2_12_FULL_69_13]|nr:MAG: twin arginine-targeting protein translocase TatC [Betaproteobacteria bacterium RIFCSPHIGHO2_12_FULL_69_13]OGA64581.1 MAG: twin arginine-targeting protein translocase TatC [Betaproteobacteria bacterium RIFCSPLOWO2_12_FULL_68_20]
MSDQETFISHLVELRERVVRALAVVLVLFLVMAFGWPGAGAIYDVLALPLMNALPEGAKMIATGVITPFLVPLKVAGLAAFLIALPYVLYQLWAFVAPGLYEHEKRLALPLVFGTTILFLLGVAFCYFFVFGRVFAFIHSFAPASITPAPDIEAYFSFVITMFLAFGVTFETPIVVVMLVRTGVVTVEKLRDARPYVIVGAFVVAAIVTPPDVLSQFLLAVPMCLLYEVGLFFARFVARDAQAQAGEMTQSEADTK